jgi:hypothetical protein
MVMLPEHCLHHACIPPVLARLDCPLMDTSCLPAPSPATAGRLLM